MPVSGACELGEYRFAFPPRRGDAFTIHSATAGGWRRRYAVVRVEHRFDANVPDEPSTVVIVRPDLDAQRR